MKYINIPYEMDNEYRYITFKKVRGYEKQVISNRLGMDVMYSRCGKTYCFAIRYSDFDHISFFAFDYDENDNLLYIPVTYSDIYRFVDIRGERC